MDPLEGVEYVMDGLSAMLVSEDRKTANRARALRIVLGRLMRLTDQPWPTARVHAAVDALYERFPQHVDLLRALTAFVGQDLPIAEHFIRVAQLAEAHDLSPDTDPLHDLDSKLPKNPTLADTRPVGYAEIRQADKELGVETDEGDAMLSGVAPTVHDLPLHVGKFFTDTLGKVLSPLMGRAKRSAEEQAEKDAESRAARAGLSALDKKMAELAELAASHPTQLAFLPMGDAEDWATALDDDAALARLPAPAQELFRALRAERKAREGLEAEDLKKRDHTPLGRLLASVGRMRAIHDAGALSYGEVHLQYDAKTRDYTLAERVITLDADSALILKNPLEGGKEGAGLTTLRELIDSYVKKRKGNDNWDRSGDFWRRRVIEFRELDRPAPGTPVDLSAEGKRIPFDARAVTQLGYAVSEALGDTAPANDLLAFTRGLDSLMSDGSKIYLLDVPNGTTRDALLRDKVVSRYREDGATFGGLEKTRRYDAQVAQGIERRAGREAERAGRIAARGGSGGQRNLAGAPHGIPPPPAGSRRSDIAACARGDRGRRLHPGSVPENRIGSSPVSRSGRGQPAQEPTAYGA